MEASRRENGSDRRFLLASALRPEDARRSAAELPEPIDLVVTSPTELARQAPSTAPLSPCAWSVVSPRRSGNAGSSPVAPVR